MLHKKEELSLQLTETLRSLCALPAVSGFEAQAAQAVADLLRPLCDTVETDRSGSVLAWKKCGRKHAKTVLLDAHLDQIGFVVTEVLDGGFVRFAPVGGVDRALLREALSRLPAREKRIISMRFGIGLPEPMTQKEVADCMGISQSYISRLEKRILARMRREMQQHYA